MLTDGQNTTISSDQIFHAYGELFPDEFEFLVLYHLYKNYPSMEMQYAEIKQAIVDTSRLPFLFTGRQRQVETTFKKLLNNFVERVPARFNFFILTPHAEKVIEIVTQRISNPYLKFPLKETFEIYFLLPNDVSDNIDSLRRWFKLGFQNNARQVVIGHLEALKLSVDDAIKALNEVLDADNLSAVEMLDRFSQRFQVLGEQARQITEAIKTKVDVHYQLRDIAGSFAQRANNFQQRTDQPEVGIDSIKGDRDHALQIKDEVYAFFDKVDQQLDVINTKMTFACSKIAELQESLRAQSHYKIGLKKMLVYLLENSKPDASKWIRLPDKFPQKNLVVQRFRFKTLRYYDMGFLRKVNPIYRERDTEYETNQREQFELELANQGYIREYCEKMQIELRRASSIDVSSEIFNILRQHPELEIAVQAGYDFMHSLGNDHVISIKEELQSDSRKVIHLWKVIVEKANNSAS